MSLVGRRKEIEILDDIMDSGMPEFIAVYGRRRIGKTFLIKEYFNDRFTFYATGINGAAFREQLKNFRDFLVEYGDTDKEAPSNWFDAFRRLRLLLEKKDAYKDAKHERKVVFLDEVPWMDTQKSGFKAALDRFWNAWGSRQTDLVLIVCGSATSRVVNSLLKSKGGFYNRLTNQIHLMPFSLKECKEYAEMRHLVLSQDELLRYYMVFGGVPYYWSLLAKGKSLPQNVQRLCFDIDGPLKNEYSSLFRSLFSEKGEHRLIVETMAKKKSGLTRKELVENGVKDGEILSDNLEDLIQCGFVKRIRNGHNKIREAKYLLIDPFVCFSLTFLSSDKTDNWQTYFGSPSYYAWQGNAFELVCLNNITSLKSALGISGVETNEFSWRSSSSVPGAQIDLVIERKDGVSNICEMKYSEDAFSIDGQYEKVLRNKLTCYRLETKTKNALHLTMVVANGFVNNEHSSLVSNVIDGSELFL